MGAGRWGNIANLLNNNNNNNNNVCEREREREREMLGENVQGLYTRTVL
jgi:hypothetical protein